MVKKKNTIVAAGATSSGATVKITSGAPKRGASEISAAAPAPEVSTAAPAPGDWPASTTTKRDEKKARSLGLISTDEGDVILPALQDPFDSDHQPSEVLLTAECFPKLSDGNLEEGGSTAPSESCAKVNEMFEDEDNDPANPELRRSDEGFIEPPSKKAKASPSRPTPAASEASARAAAATAQPSTASSLPKGKENPSPAAAAVLPSSAEKPDIQAVISSLKSFASQFSSLGGDKIRLQEEVESTSSNLDTAVKLAAAACQNADSLKKELDQRKKRLKEEEKENAESEAQRKEKEGLLHRSTLDLLGAADIPAGPGGKLPDNSSADALSMAIESGDLVRALLQKNKDVMSKLHAMIFPKADQEKSLEQLTDVFAIDTEATIELMMGYDFKADMETMTKELPKDQNGQAIDLSLFKVSARKCALQLLGFDSANKSSAGKAGPMLPVAPVPSFAEGSSTNDSENDRLQRMKTRIRQLKQDMRGLHAMAAIIKKKGELAIDAERYAMNELHKATESLNFIALNLSEDKKRVHERVDSLISLARFDEVFWKNQSKAATVAKFSRSGATRAPIL
nr:uncharacterized protein LOC127348217 [Lolium perenne]